MKKILLILLSLLVTLCTRGQGKPYGGPIGNSVERYAPPEHYVLLKNLFKENTEYKAQLVKVGDINDSSFMVYVLKKGENHYGVQDWIPLFSCNLGPLIFDYQIIEIEGSYFFYYKIIKDKKQIWLRINILNLPKETPTLLSAFLFYKLDFIFSATTSASPSS
jgi:hypothetical protein